MKNWFGRHGTRAIAWVCKARDRKGRDGLVFCGIRWWTASTAVLATCGMFLFASAGPGPEGVTRWHALRDGGKREWTLTLSWMQGVDCLVEGRKDLFRHRRTASLNDHGELHVVKGRPEGFERFRQIGPEDRALVLESVLDALETFTLEPDRDHDVQTSRTVKLQSGARSVSIQMTSPIEARKGLVYLFQIGAK